MDLRLPRVAEFLETVRKDFGNEVATACEGGIRELPPGTAFHPFVILTEARYRLQEHALEHLAAMNARPFD